MGKFIRRLFILLVILTIAFLIYRYINPEGASRLVDKIKAIPDRFTSSDVVEENEEDLSITGTTLTITGDIDVSIETGEEDMTWLEELNQEIEDILGTDDEEEELEEDFDGEEKNMETIDLTDCVSYFDGCNTCMVTNGEIAGCTKKYCEINEEPKCLKYIEEELDEDEVVEENNQDQEEQNDSGQSEGEEQGLTNTDYQQMEDIFGNLVE